MAYHMHTYFNHVLGKPRPADVWKVKSHVSIGIVNNHVQLVWVTHGASILRDSCTLFCFLVHENGDALVGVGQAYTPSSPSSAS